AAGGIGTRSTQAVPAMAFLAAPIAGRIGSIFLIGRWIQRMRLSGRFGLNHRIPLVVELAAPRNGPLIGLGRHRGRNQSDSGHASDRKSPQAATMNIDPHLQSPFLKTIRTLVQCVPRLLRQSVAPLAVSIAARRGSRPGTKQPAWPRSCAKAHRT